MYECMYVEHSDKGINGCHLRNAKLFKRIEHSDSLKCKQTKVNINALNVRANIRSPK